jgi:phage-related holin
MVTAFYIMTILFGGVQFSLIWLIFALVGDVISNKVNENNFI